MFHLRCYFNMSVREKSGGGQDTASHTVRKATEGPKDHPQTDMDTTEHQLLQNSKGGLISSITTPKECCY